MTIFHFLLLGKSVQGNSSQTSTFASHGTGIQGNAHVMNQNSSAATAPLGKSLNCPATFHFHSELSQTKGPNYFQMKQNYHFNYYGNERFRSKLYSLQKTACLLPWVTRFSQAKVFFLGRVWYPGYLFAWKEEKGSKKRKQNRRNEMKETRGKQGREERRNRRNMDRKKGRGGLTKEGMKN